MANKNVDFTAEDQTLKNAKPESQENAFEDSVIRAFDAVLERDEKIIKAYKPNKTKMILGGIINVTIPLLFFALFTLLVVLLDMKNSTRTEILVATILPAALFVFCVLTALLINSLLYKNTFYAYTNKRIIVRTGIFGVDYKSLEIVSIGATDVYVSLIDKIIHKNTGTIRFGSNSSPIASSGYNFMNMVNPYEEYKLIKEHIENVKKGNDK